MGKLVKRLKGIIIFIAVESFSYLKMKPKDLEMFFMIWGFISLALLLYNIFNVNSGNALAGLGGTDSTNYAHLSSSFAEQKYGIRRNEKRRGGGLLDSTNLLYLSFVIVNIIGYIFVMPK